MTESKLFLSSCSRRDLTRRRGRTWFTTATEWLTHPAVAALVCVAICGGAFIAGRGGI